MSTNIPPDDPRWIDEKELRQAYVDAIRRAQAWEAQASERAEQLQASLPQTIKEAVPPTLAAQSQPNFGWISTALQSITLVTIVGCAFWLGSLSTTVSTTSQKVDKLNDAVVGVSRDSLSNRLVTIEAKLEAIDKKIERAGAAQQTNTR